MLEKFSLKHLINQNYLKFSKQKYLYIIILLLNKASLYFSFSLDIKLSTSEDKYKRNLSPSIQYIFGSMFKINYYYINLYIGDSMEKQGFILDTGSSITTSSCSLCKKCGKHIYPPYKLNSSKKIISCEDKKCKMLSSNCKDKKCSFRISYAEGSSLEGIFINKKIYFNNNTEKRSEIEIPIGCTLSENNLFYKQEVNGIMGLNNNEFNFVEILYKLGRIEKNIFSLCFAQLGGVFTLGEINYKFHKSNITYIPIRSEKNKYYKIQINSIFINDEKLENYSSEENNFLLDSGATISYFNNKIFDEILNKMLEKCNSYKNGICGSYKLNSILGHCFYFNNTYELNEAIQKYWPIIHFNIEGYDYKWLPENYYFNISNKNITGACMGFNKIYRKRNTLGGSWLIGHDIIFDRERNLLGIAEANCYQNKNLNLTNGLELIDFKKNDYYKNEVRIFSFLIITFINILICGIIIFIFLYFFKFKKKKNRIIDKTINIKDNILFNTNEAHHSITNNKSFI